MALQVNIFREVNAALDLAKTEVKAAVAATEKRYLDVGLTFPPDWLTSGWGGIRTEAGIAITPITAFQCNTFLTCVDLISSSLASLPLHVQERTIGPSGRPAHRIAYEHDLYDLIHLEPNEEMTRHTWIKTFLIHCLAWSNGYCEIQRDGGGNAVGLWPRNPSATRPRRYALAVRLPATPWRPYPVVAKPYELLYETADPVDNYDFAEFGVLKDGVGRLMLAADVLHVPGISFDGRLGTSITWLAREILAQYLAQIRYTSTYFRNDARPQGILSVPHQNAEDRRKTKEEWQRSQRDGNEHSVVVLPAGIEWKPMTNNPKDSQATELMQEQIRVIAALFHVPARMAGDTSHASRGTTEQENQEFLTYTMSPWINACQQEFKRKLFPHPGVGRRAKNPFYAHFDTAELVRPDAASRTAYYSSGRQWGYLNGDDIRAMEHLNPIEDAAGETYWMPVNMTDADNPAPAKPGSQEESSDNEA